MKPSGQAAPKPMPHLDLRAAVYQRETGDPGIIDGSFVAWLHERFAEYQRETGRGRLLTAADHDAFDRWLEGRG